MKMGGTRGSWVAPALIVTVLAAVVAVFWTPVVGLILEPLAWLLWAGWRVLASVDQEIWWVILAVACAVPIIRLFDTQLRLHDVSRSGETTDSGAGGRAEHWTNRAAGLAQGDGGREALRGDLESLAASVAEATRLPLPSGLGREQASSKRPSARRAAPGWAGAGLLHWMPGARRRADRRAIEELLKWMEVALEIRDDEHSQ
jgi:hypothetical protein